MALIMAAVAEEGSIATEPPVDIAALAKRFQDILNGNGRNAIRVVLHAFGNPCRCVRRQ
ncbi:MAG: hypothetical protein ACRDS1_06855 [Pseudonocardiaceae bacterium]